MPGLDLSALVPIIEEMILQDTVRFTTPAGDPVFNPDTGQYEAPPGTAFYEGPGAVQVAGTVGGVTALPSPNLPWVDETRSKYKVLTPLSAPIAERDTIVTVVAVHEGGDLTLLGRQWRAQDPSIGGTIGVVRMTTLDQIQQTREA
jgi:hypothetical protein